MLAGTVLSISSLWKAQTSSPRSMRGQNPFCPGGVVQPTCLPLMQEITGAKPVRDAILSARGLRGIADPPDLEPGSLGRASRLAPTSSMPPKHFQRCACSVSRPAWCNSGWGLHFIDHPTTSQSSQRSSGFHNISPLRPGQHRRLRPFSLLAAARWLSL